MVAVALDQLHMLAYPPIDVALHILLFGSFRETVAGSPLKPHASLMIVGAGPIDDGISVFEAALGVVADVLGAMSWNEASPVHAVDPCCC